jgi:small ligand-binding sensory domain FIST
VGATSEESGEDALWSYEERYVVGVDEGRGAFAMGGSFRSGDHLSLALPDSETAREALRASLGEIAATPLVLQFACRARDAGLHGDPDLESAWTAHHAGDRVVVGTVSPFQLASDAEGRARLLVHATVLLALGEERA